MISGPNATNPTFQVARWRHSADWWSGKDRAAYRGQGTGVGRRGSGFDLE